MNFKQFMGMEPLPVATIPKPKPQVSEQQALASEPNWIARSDTIDVYKSTVMARMENMPFSYITSGRFTHSDIAYVDSLTANRNTPRSYTEQALEQTSIAERNYALAATTPVLGQYAPTFGWPDDWGWYWEYMDARLFVPEVSYAVKLKTRQIWKPGFEFQTSSDTKTAKLKKIWRRLKLKGPLFESTQTALTFGNDYVFSADNSDSKWAEGTPADYAQGASFTNITGAPRPLVDFTSATRFHGLMNTDPRTFRIQIHPQRFDDERHTVLVEKYIQRRWAGPLAPTAVLGSSTELDFHPDQIGHLAFNKIAGSIYGYSQFREVLFTLKGYLIMVQFLPAIVEKRADPLLTVTTGGEVSKPGGMKETMLPTEKDFKMVKERIQSRMPGEDIFVDVLTKIDEVYKGRGAAERVEQYITTYKERVMMGLGIPMTSATLSGGAEIKWGTLNFELMEDETRENQEKLADFIGDWVVPKMKLALGYADGQAGPEVMVTPNIK